MKNKAQVVTMDVYVSIIFFVMVFVLWVFISNHLITQAQESYEISMMDKKLQRISDLLIRTKGVPEDWNETNVRSIGLAESEYVINISKLFKLVIMDPVKRRQTLGFGGYNLYLKVTNLTDQNFYTIGDINTGSDPGLGKPSVVLSINRFFLLDFGSCISNSTFFLRNEPYSPYPTNPWLPINFSATTPYFPLSNYAPITLVPGVHVYFYQKPPLSSDFTFPDNDIPWNFTLWIANPTPNNANLKVRVMRYKNVLNPTAIEVIPNLETQTYAIPANSPMQPYTKNFYKEAMGPDIKLEAGEGLVFDIYAEVSNLILYYGGFNAPSNFMVPGEFPPTCEPREQIGKMQLILWR